MCKFYICINVALRCCVKIIITPKYCYAAASKLLLHQNTATMLYQIIYYIIVALRRCVKIIITPKYFYDAASDNLLHHRSTTLLYKNYYYTKMFL